MIGGGQGGHAIKSPPAVQGAALPIGTVGISAASAARNQGPLTPRFCKAEYRNSVMESPSPDYGRLCESGATGAEAASGLGDSDSKGGAASGGRQNR